MIRSDGQLPEPYEEWPGFGSLYCGDCLEILPLLSAGSVDAVVTDPPYAFAGGISNGRVLDSSDQFFRHWILGLLSDLLPLVAGNGCQFWFCDWKTVGLIANGIQSASKRVRSEAWTLSQCLVWDREQMGMGSPFRASHELIGFARGPQFKWDGPRDVLNVIRHPWPYTGHEFHSAEKPVELIAKLISFCGRGPILDPFIGSGTTAVACIRTGRKFIGIELEERYCAIAKDRVDQELTTPRLPFVEPVKEKQAELFGEAV